jgi:hypothetical protein
VRAVRRFVCIPGTVGRNLEELFLDRLADLDAIELAGLGHQIAASTVWKILSGDVRAVHAELVAAAGGKQV